MKNAMRTNGGIILILATLLAESAASAAQTSSGRSSVFVRKSDNNEIRSTFDLDFSKTLLAKETIAELLSGEVLNVAVYGHNAAKPSLDVFVETIDNTGGEILSLVSQGNSSTTLQYSNYRDPRFTVILVGCYYNGN